MKKIVVRAAVESDLAFIMSTWLRGLRYGNSWFKLIDKEAYYSKYTVVLNNLLRSSVVAVACLIDDPNVVVGYAVVSPETLHWVYVKKSWRGFGLAKELTQPFRITRVSHLTKLGRRLKPLGWRFDPFL